jgi:hypothetical protein
MPGVLSGMTHVPTLLAATLALLVVSVTVPAIAAPRVTSSHTAR